MVPAPVAEAPAPAPAPAAVPAPEGAEGAATAPAGASVEATPEPGEPRTSAPIAGQSGLSMESPAGTGFWLAGYRRGDLHVYDLDTELVVGGAGYFARAREDGTLERIEGTLAGLVDPGVMYLAGWNMGALGGRWPDPVWAFTQTDYQRGSSAPFMYYRKGDRWQRKATATGLLDWYYEAFAPWQKGQVLALRLYRPRLEIGENMEEMSDAETRRLAAANAKNPPRLDVLAAGVAPAPAPFRFAAGGAPLAFGAAPTGEVFALLEFTERRGTGEDVEEVRTYGVQRFTPGAAEGPVDRLPQLAWQLGNSVYVRGKDDVYVFGQDSGGAGLVLHHDGRAWSPSEAPPDGAVGAFVAAGDTFWAIATRRGGDEASPATALWKRAGTGAWTAVPLPQVREPGGEAERWTYGEDVEDWSREEGQSAPQYAAVEPAELRVRGQDLWVAGPLKDAISADGMMVVHAVLRTRPVARALRFPGDADLRRELLDLGARAPNWGDNGCSGGPGPWVRIATLPPRAPEELAPRIVQEVLAGLPEELRGDLELIREAEVQGRRVIGAHVSVFDAEAEKALVAALKGLRPDEEHPVECRVPRPIRELHNKWPKAPGAE